MINSFNVKKFNNYKVLMSLLGQVVDVLDELNIPNIESKAHITNNKSICFHRNMEFKEVNKTTTEVEFFINKDDLVSNIRNRLFRLEKEAQV